MFLKNWFKDPIVKYYLTYPIYDALRLIFNPHLIFLHFKLRKQLRLQKKIGQNMYMLLIIFIRV